MSQQSIPPQDDATRDSGRITAALTEARNLEDKTKAVVHRPRGLAPMRSDPLIAKILESIDSTTSSTMDSALDLVKSNTTRSKDVEVELQNKVDLLTHENSKFKEALDTIHQHIRDHSTVFDLEHELKETHALLAAANERIGLLEETIEQLKQRHKADLEHSTHEVDSYELRIQQLLKTHRDEMESQRLRFEQDVKFQISLASVDMTPSPSIAHIGPALESAVKEFVSSLQKIEAASDSPPSGVSHENIVQAVDLFKRATEEAESTKRQYHMSASAFDEAKEAIFELSTNIQKELSRLSILQITDLYPPKPAKTFTGITKGQHQARR